MRTHTQRGCVIVSAFLSFSTGFTLRKNKQTLTHKEGVSGNRFLAKVNFSAIKKGETTKGAFIENYAAMSLPIFLKWLI